MNNLLFIIMFLTIEGGLFAAKLDITSNINSSIKSFSNLINENKSYNLSYITNSASVSFTLKNIVLEKTSDSTMDISINFKTYTINDSSEVLNSLYIKDIYEFYRINTVFINKAYTRIYKFPYPCATLTFGKMPYKLAKGLVLSDNDRGVDGLKLDLTSKLFADIIEFFYFKTNNQSSINTLGFSYNISFGDGIWQFYGVNIKTDESKEPTNTFEKTNRNYYGFSYFIDKNNITYSFEFAKQKGKSYLSNSSKDDDAYALKINSSWFTKLPILGHTKARAGYFKSSGGENQSKNKTFYSYLTDRFSDFDYKGIGTIYKASVYGLSKASDTTSGLPQGIYGIKTVNVGIDIALKRNITLSFDYFKHKAFQSQSSDNIGKEYTSTLTSKLSEKTSLSLIFSEFSPQGILKLNQTKTRAFLINIKAGF